MCIYISFHEFKRRVVSSFRVMGIRYSARDMQDAPNSKRFSSSVKIYRAMKHQSSAKDCSYRFNKFVHRNKLNTAISSEKKIELRSSDFILDIISI